MAISCSTPYGTNIAGPFDGIFSLWSTSVKRIRAWPNVKSAASSFMNIWVHTGFTQIFSFHAKMAPFRCICILSRGVAYAPSAVPYRFRPSARCMSIVFSICIITRIFSPVLSRRSWTNGFFQHAVLYGHTPLRLLRNPLVVCNQEDGSALFMQSM